MDRCSHCRIKPADLKQKTPCNTQAVARKRKCPYAAHAAGTPILEENKTPRGDDPIVRRYGHPGDQDALTLVGFGYGKYPL